MRHWEEAQTPPTKGVISKAAKRWPKCLTSTIFQPHSPASGVWRSRAEPRRSGERALRSGERLQRVYLEPWHGRNAGQTVPDRVRAPCERDFPAGTLFLRTGSRSCPNSRARMREHREGDIWGCHAKSSWSQGKESYGWKQNKVRKHCAETEAGSSSIQMPSLTESRHLGPAGPGRAFGKRFCCVISSAFPRLAVIRHEAPYGDPGQNSPGRALKKLVRP